MPLYGPILVSALEFMNKLGAKQNLYIYIQTINTQHVHQVLQ